MLDKLKNMVYALVVMLIVKHKLKKLMKERDKNVDL